MSANQRNEKQDCVVLPWKRGTEREIGDDLSVLIALIGAMVNSCLPPK